MPDTHRAFNKMSDTKGFPRLQGQFARILQLSIHYRSTISQYRFAGAFAGGDKFLTSIAHSGSLLSPDHVILAFFMMALP
jgi:pyoverdine/dityrosine biosynthesis protein Dit1